MAAGAHPSSEFEFLAAGLCNDTGIAVEVGDIHWSWDPYRNVINVPADDLEVKGAQYCAGVIVHEVGHVCVSRYDLFKMAHRPRFFVTNLLNAIEDPRCNTYMRRRYPGTGDWLDDVAASDHEGPRQWLRSATALPEFLTFCLECAAEEWRGWTPAPPEAGLPSSVVEALDATRTTRREYARTLPPTSVDPRDLDVDVVAQYREKVWPRLIPGAVVAAPEVWEQGVRVSAFDALELAEREIFPHAQKLFEQDRDRIARMLADRDRAQQMLEALGGLNEALDRALRRLLARAPDGEPTDDGAETRRGLAEQIMEVLLSRATRAPLSGSRSISIGSRRRPPSPSPPRSARHPPRPARVRQADPTSQSEYEKAYRSVAAQVDRLATDIEAILAPKRRLKERCG